MTPKIINKQIPERKVLFSPRKRRKRARTLATFATRKLLTRGLAAATQFASLTRPDRFAAGASRSSVNLTSSAQANLRDTCAEDERSESEGSRADRRSSARAKRSGLKAPRKGLRNFALHYSTANCPQYSWSFYLWGSTLRPHAEGIYKKLKYITEFIWLNYPKATFITLSVSGELQASQFP